MMEFRKTLIPGCYEITPKVIEDSRGRFIKVFHNPSFKKWGINEHFTEQYYSVSNKRVLRGLHFQTPPYDLSKLVYCVAGKVIDVVLDLSKGSPTYGKHFMLELNSDTANLLYIPRGLAHGFYVISEQATLVYNVTTAYNAEYDKGIHWQSAGILWLDNNPIVSPRDRQFPALIDFESPFAYHENEYLMPGS